MVVRAGRIAVTTMRGGSLLSVVSSAAREAMTQQGRQDSNLQPPVWTLVAFGLSKRFEPPLHTNCTGHRDNLPGSRTRQYSSSRRASSISCPPSWCRYRAATDELLWPMVANARAGLTARALDRRLGA